MLRLGPGGIVELGRSGCAGMAPLRAGLLFGLGFKIAVDGEATEPAMAKALSEKKDRRHCRYHRHWCAVQLNLPVGLPTEPNPQPVRTKASISAYSDRARDSVRFGGVTIWVPTRGSSQT